MPQLNNDDPTFNLWTEPWITLVLLDGTTRLSGLEQTLLRAHEISSVYEPSPLAVVGLHRLLAAILQAVLRPRRPSDLQKIWRAGRFPVEPLAAFGQQYCGRFDLFSAKTPFLQSADLPRQPAKKPEPKSVTYLTPEIPAGTAITHYHHGAEDNHAFCPACAAMGLVTIPAFATSGGAGIKPSINGVPPIYVLPGGRTLFESLAASLILPDYQPTAASTASDLAWWLHPPHVPRSAEVYEVGYLHSLTFPARRVRLHPIRLKAPCTRCGRPSDWGVSTMVFEMGESRPKDASFWFDPFVAYRLPTEKSKKSIPTPIRPQAGQALWREFANLFLQGGENTLRPSVLDQMAKEGIDTGLSAYAFRCVGMRTDMKAKIFEWVEAGFEIPPPLLADPAAGEAINEAIRFATDCAAIIRAIFREAFGGASKKSERHRTLNSRMQDDYWAALAAPFREFVLAMVDETQRSVMRRSWIDRIMREAKEAFKQSAALLGDDALTLRQRVRGEQRCDIFLAKKRKETLTDE